MYGFTDLDGSQPDAWRYIQEVTEAETDDTDAFLEALRTQIQYLTSYPDLTADVRQTTLLSILSQIQKIQSSKPRLS